MAHRDDSILLGDMPIRRIGFGAMRITGRGVWGPPKDQRAAIALLRRVVDLGITFIDTADSYGPDVSEELIASALHPYPSGLVIGTKGGMVRGGPWDWAIDSRPDRLRTCVEGSLRKLRTETIDLYQLHRPDPRIPIEESLGALVTLQAEGKIRHLGVCNLPPGLLRRAQASARIVSVQNHHNLADRTDRAVLDTCKRNGLVFFAYFPLGDAGDGTGPALVAAAPGSPQASVAARHGATPAQVALAWMIRTLPFAVPIPGTSSARHLDENAGALDLARRLTDDDLALLATIETAPGVY